MKVYIVSEEDDMEFHTRSVHTTYKGALEVAKDLAEYAGLEKRNKWHWASKDEFAYVFIQEMEVQE